LKCRERMGSSLPPAELARRDSALFEKMKCIFSIAPVGNLEKSRECSSHRNTHRTLAAEAPDAEVVRPVCCGARVKHQTVNTGRRGAHVHASDAILLWPVCLTGSTGRSGSVRWCASGGTLRERPVVCVRWPERFAELSDFKSGEHRTVRCSASGDSVFLQTSVCLGPVYTRRVRWHLAQRPALCRLPLDSDMWLTLEHQTQVLSVRCPFKSVR